MLPNFVDHHYDDVIMSAIPSLITGVLIIYSTVCSGAHQRKHQSSASLAFVRGIHRWPMNSPHKMPVARKMFPFDGVIIMMNAVVWSLNTWSVSLTAKGPEGGGGLQNTYELLNQRALKYSPVNKVHIFQCMGMIFCVEFQRYPLKFHTKYSILPIHWKVWLLYNIEILKSS